MKRARSRARFVLHKIPSLALFPTVALRKQTVSEWLATVVRFSEHVCWDWTIHSRRTTTQRRTRPTGWAENAKGQRLLWLPIIRLTAEAADFRIAKGKSELTSADELAVLSLHDLFKKLAVTLRELHEATRSEITPGFLKGADRAKAAMTGKRLELGPLYVDLALVYLRRLADSLAATLRPLVFGKKGAAPMRYSALQEFCSDPRGFVRLDPLVDPDEFLGAIRSHSRWIGQLRKTYIDAQGKQQKGVRDVREHHASLLDVGFSITGNRAYQMSALMAVSPSHQPPGEILSMLQSGLADLCALLTAIHRSIWPRGRYTAWDVPVGDCLHLTGDWMHGTGFWPHISA